MLQEEKMEEKRKKDKEEIQKRFADVERRQAEEREADRERKRERARRAKEAGPEAIRMGKYVCHHQRTFANKKQFKIIKNNKSIFTN